MTRPNFESLDEVHDDISKLIDKINQHYSSGNHKHEVPLQTCMRVVYRMALEYYLAAFSLAKVDKVNLSLSAASLVRALIEVGADVNHIFVDKNKIEKRAESYKASVDAYFDAMMQMAKRMNSNEDFSLKFPNPWTSSNIQNRVAALGPDTVKMYDYFSAFTHANPGYQVYLVQEQLGESLRFNVLKSALAHMLYIIGYLAIIGIDLDRDLIRQIDEKLFATTA